MLRNVLEKLATEIVFVHRHVKYRYLVQRAAPVFVPVRGIADVKDDGQRAFDVSLLEVLVCPLSKKPLRFEAETNELINEELGIAYPITDGIPNLIPREARLLQKDTPTTDTSPQE
ncbi:protein preY, mitochondrial [Aulostomus maculatus]